MPLPAAATPTLVLFCRRPAPGVGKQRIAAELGAGFACGLGEALLGAALEDCAAWPGAVVIAPASEQDAGWAQGLARAAWRVLPQPAGNLGERLAGIDARLRTDGHTHLHYIGSDAPLLDEAYYESARQALRDADVVLGPARDGGVTLMGSRRAWPELGDLPWSSDRLGQALAERCAASGYTLEWLPEQDDVDRPADLPALRDALAQDPRPARRALAAWLDQSSRPRRQ